jgi:hypothetical protein
MEKDMTKEMPEMELNSNNITNYASKYNCK